MSLLSELTSIRNLQDTLTRNKVANFSYTDLAYTNNEVAGVTDYNFNAEQNIPVAESTALKVNPTVLQKGYRSQASSITRMLVNHFFGRTSYNLNKVNDQLLSALQSIINSYGKPEGIATLDINGRLPYSQLPESAMEFKGTWSAATNTPTLANGKGSTGDFYICSEAGSVNLGSDIQTFLVGDRIIYDGSIWQKIAGGSVRSVNLQTPNTSGDILITGSNIPVSPTNSDTLSDPITEDRLANGAVTGRTLNLSRSCRIISDNPRYLQYRWTSTTHRELEIVTPIQIVKSDGTYITIPAQVIDIEKLPFASFSYNDTFKGGRCYYLGANGAGTLQLSAITPPAITTTNWVFLGCFTLNVAQISSDPDFTTEFPLIVYNDNAPGSTSLFWKPVSPWSDKADYFYSVNISLKDKVSKYVASVRSPLLSFIALDIIPESVWCSSFHPACPKSNFSSWQMVYDSATNLAVDIYINSIETYDAGVRRNTLLSSYWYSALGNALADRARLSYDRAIIGLLNAGKRLPTLQECYSFSLGCNSGLKFYSNSPNPLRCGDLEGRKDSESAPVAKLRSVIGVEAPCGILGFWTQDKLYKGASAGIVSLPMDNYPTLGVIEGASTEIPSSTAPGYLINAYGNYIKGGQDCGIFTSSLTNPFYNNESVDLLTRGVCDVVYS